MDILLFIPILYVIVNHIKIPLKMDFSFNVFSIIIEIGWYIFLFIPAYFLSLYFLFSLIFINMVLNLFLIYYIILSNKR
mgnify:FL=1